MTKKLTLLWNIVGLTSLFIGAGPAARADEISETVTVDTSALATSPASEIYFYLIGDGGNAATLSSFVFGGGSPGTFDSLNSTGGVSGDMSSTVSITDASSFTNVFAQYFTPGSAISFLLNLTTNVAAGPTPDQFGFAILDPSGNPISTSDPTGDDNLAVINIDSTSPSTMSYSGLVTVTPSGTVVTPEPSTAWLLGAGMFAIVLVSLCRSAFRTNFGCEQPERSDNLTHAARTQRRKDLVRAEFGAGG